MWDYVKLKFHPEDPDIDKYYHIFRQLGLDVYFLDIGILVIEEGTKDLFEPFLKELEPFMSFI